MKQTDNKKYQLFSRVALVLAILYLLPSLLALLVYVGIVPAYIIWQTQAIDWNELNKSWLALLLTLSVLPAGLVFWWLFRFPDLLALCCLRKYDVKQASLERFQCENSLMRSSLQQYYHLEKDIISLSQQRRICQLHHDNHREEWQILTQRLQHFLRQGCHNLALDCLADVIFIAVFSPDDKQDLQVHVGWEFGRFFDDRYWSIADFPDTGGIENEVFIYQDASLNYPCKLIQHYKADSYFAIPLCSPFGEQLGLLCLMANQANALAPDALVFLNIYAHYVALLLDWEKQLKTPLKPFCLSQDYPRKVDMFDINTKQAAFTNEKAALQTGMAEDQEPETALNSPLRILVAEDSEINQVVIKKILQRLGYQADYADDGQMAFTLWQQNHYDLILMDCQMPKMDGYHTAELIRETERKHGLEHTPIVALTAYALNKHKERAKTAGMDDYISKPIRVEILQALLANYSQVKNVAPTTQGHPLPTVPPLNHRPQVLNPSIMQDLSKTLGQQIQALLSQFIQYLPGQIDALAIAIQQKDSELLRQKSHQLKGESMQIGAETLGSLCKELETFANNNEFEQAEKHLSLMQNELQQVIKALKQENEKQQTVTANE